MSTGPNMSTLPQFKLSQNQSNTTQISAPVQSLELLYQSLQILGQIEFSLGQEHYANYLKEEALKISNELFQNIHVASPSEIAAGKNYSETGFSGPTKYEAEYLILRKKACDHIKELTLQKIKKLHSKIYDFSKLYYKICSTIDGVENPTDHLLADFVNNMCLLVTKTYNVTKEDFLKSNFFDALRNYNPELFTVRNKK